MAGYQTSNIATYKMIDGTPVHDAHFIEVTTDQGPCLIAFESEDLRQRALAVRASDGSERKPVNAIDAYFRVRTGERAFLYHPDEINSTYYIPLALSGGMKGNWTPRVIQGGKVA